MAREDSEGDCFQCDVCGGRWLEPASHQPCPFCEIRRLQAIMDYLETHAPLAIGTRQSCGEREYWVGTVDGPVYGNTVIEAVEAAAAKQEG